MEKGLERIKSVLEKYNEQDAKAFKDTIDMLCSKGIGNGCYQDYALLMDVISILTIAESIVRGNKMIELANKCYEVVSSKYENMLTSFQADFSLATTYDDLDYADFRELIRKKNERLLKDIELLSELEFKVRYKQILIVEVTNEQRRTH